MSREPWTSERAQDWYAGQPWPVGCNFIPSSAVNQLEMWQADTFDLDTIDRELGWVSDIGFNAARVFLHDLLWRQDSDGFRKRIDSFLDVAARHGIRTLFVLFDGVWDPIPGSVRSRLRDPVFTTPAGYRAPAPRYSATAPGTPASAHTLPVSSKPFGTMSACSAGTSLTSRTTRTLRMATGNCGTKRIWPRRSCETPSSGRARQTHCSPSPPAPGEGAVDDRASEINRLMLDESDIISFHSYMDAGRVESRLRTLEDRGRPILLSEFMARDESTFESVLPVARALKVGAFCWGLVSGKTQTVYPWDSWTNRYEAEPDPWFHDVFRPDGTPYRQGEVDFIRRIAR